MVATAILREQLLGTADRRTSTDQTEGDASLDNTQRTVADAVGVHIATASESVQQREHLDKLLESLVDINQTLGRSRRTLRCMAIRVFTNKLIGTVVVLVLILIFILSAWLKYWKLQ